MESVGSVITLLFVIGFMACLVGLIRPSLFAKKGAAPPPRREFLTCIVSMLVLLAIGGAIFFPDEPATSAGKSGQAQQPAAPPAQAEAPAAVPAREPPLAQAPVPAYTGLDFPVAEWLSRQNDKALRDGLPTFSSTAPGTICTGSCLQMFVGGGHTYVVVRQQRERITGMLFRGDSPRDHKEFFMQLRNTLAILAPDLSEKLIEKRIIAMLKTLSNENEATLVVGNIRANAELLALDQVQVIIIAD